MVAPKRAVCFVVQANHLCSLSADSAGQLNVLGHDGDTLGMDGAQVGVFKETNEVSLASFLKSHDSRALETQIGLETKWAVLAGSPGKCGQELCSSCGILTIW